MYALGYAKASLPSRKATTGPPGGDPVRSPGAGSLAEQAGAREEPGRRQGGQQGRDGRGRGPEADRDQEGAVVREVRPGVEDLGGTLATPRDPNRHGALICIRSTDAERLVAELAQEGIVTSSRDGSLRVSAHAYNTPEDVKAVLWELARKRALLA